MDARVGLWRKLSAEELMFLNCGVGEDSWESLGLQGDPTSPFWRRSALGFLWKEWCYSWNSSTLATSCEVLTHWKRLWCWEGLGAGREGADRGWDGWMASRTWWTWVWVNSGSWWWTGRPGVLQSMGLQRVGHDWATELNWQNQGLMRLQSSCTSQIARGNAKWCSPSKQIGNVFKHKYTSSFTSYMKTWKHEWKPLSHVQLFVTPLTIQSIEFSRPEYWSG